MLIRVLLLITILSSCLFETSASRGRIQVGYCGKVADIERVHSAGFDYIELSTSEIVSLSESDYEKLATKLKQLELPVPVTYLFVPATIKLTGPNTNEEEQMRYVRKAFDRVSRLGARVVVFGSGPARQVPDVHRPPR